MNRMKIKETNTVSDCEPTPPYARYLVRRIRPFPNFGGSFPYLVDAVTQPGVVVGVEISPDVAMIAKKKSKRLAGPMST